MTLQNNDIIRDFPKLILASQSPRRRDLLTGLGLPFTVLPADIDESLHPSETPVAYVERLAHEKAAVIAQKETVGSSRVYVLGADTIVVLNGKILGKPVDTDQAFEYLSALSGNKHEVLTGVALIRAPNATVLTKTVASQVRMRALTPDEIRTYIQTGEPMDKAGAYALQGIGGQFIQSVTGSRSNVIGLPLEAIEPALRSVGLLGETP